MNCLNCGKEMINHFVQTKDQQISYDICESCGSLWLDKGELDKTAFEVEGSIEYSSSKPTEACKEAVRKCPRCRGKELSKVNFIGYSDIALDTCGNCGGFWLDGGEFDLINRELKAIMPVEGKGFSDFVNNVHIPYWHKRIKRPSRETDWQVDAPPIKGAKAISETELSCPACGNKLSRYEVYGIKIEGCPNCIGMFLDRDELRKLKDKVSKHEGFYDLRWMDDELDAIGKANARSSDRVCPKCQGEKLLTTNFGDSTTLIDFCPKCGGAWVDQDEFQEILQDLRSKLDSLSSREMAKKAYQEIKEVWSGPENVVSEIIDAKSAIFALLNVLIFSHPKLHAMLAGFSSATKRMGVG